MNQINVAMAEVVVKYVACREVVNMVATFLYKQNNKYFVFTFFFL